MDERADPATGERGNPRAGRPGAAAAPKIALLLSVGLLALTGCGGGATKTTGEPATGTTGTTRSTTGTTSSPSTTATGAHKKKELALSTELVEIASPVLPVEERHEPTMPARYTCDGRNTPPPFAWKGIPPGTAELVLEIIKLQPVDGKLFFPWAVAGLSPASHGIDAAAGLPAGAVVATNGYGQRTYDLCPPPGRTEEYVVVLFAVPRRLHARAGFDPLALHTTLVRTAKYQGILPFQYKRGTKG